MSQPSLASEVPPQEKWYKRAEFQRFLFLFIAIVPPFGGYLLFGLYPNALSAYYALLNWDGIGQPKFVGLDNFVTMFKDRYVWRALGHNMIFVIFIPTLVISISVVLAYLISQKGYRGMNFFKVLFFFPNVLSTVVIALLWMFIYNGSYGLLNSVIRLLGFEIRDIYWLGEISTAIWAIIPPWVWGGVGTYIIIFINAMISIPRSLYESAILEGATHMQRLFIITIPLLMPIVRVSAIFLVMGAFKGIEMILILTNGGPAGSTDVIGLYMFNLAFGDEYRNFGYASAIGMFLFVILVGAKLIIDRFTANKEVEF